MSHYSIARFDSFALAEDVFPGVFDGLSCTAPSDLPEWPLYPYNGIVDAVFGYMSQADMDTLSNLTLADYYSKLVSFPTDELTPRCRCKFCTQRLDSLWAVVEELAARDHSTSAL